MIHYISFFEHLWRNERNVADALEWHGYPVQCYQATDPRDRPGLHGAADIKRGDLVLTSVPQTLDPVELQNYKDKGAKLVCWYWDWLWGLGNRDEQYLPRLKLMDAVFSSDGFDSSEYTSRGVTCRYYLPQAAMPEDRLLPPRFGTPKHDCVFIGHLNSLDRKEMVGRLGALCNFAQYGTGGDIHRRVWGREMTSICQNSRIMIGINYRNDIPGYWSDRVYVMLGAGGFYLGQHVPGIERQFKDGVHCGFFDGFTDMERKVKWWLAHDAERERCRRAGNKLVHEKHTYIHRVDTLLETCKQLGLLR